jgi:hypothetical protein
MSELLWSCVGLVLLAIVATECEAESLRKVPPYKCMHGAEDYSFMWWAYGLRDERRVRCYQTGRYGLAIDTESVQILHLGTIADAANAEEVLTQNNDTVLNLPPARLDLSVTIQGKKYLSSFASLRFLIYLRLHSLNKISQRNGSQIFSASEPDSDGVVSLFTLSDDQHVGHFF